MKATAMIHIRLVVASIAILVLAVSPAELNGQRNTAGTVSIGSTDLGGVVTSTKGPEAGVWVIAETTDLPTKLAKIVVTDDQGRYVMPDLPKANYNVWVRGYGLVDSPKVKTMPGKIVNLNAVIATTPGQAAEYYPAIYWFSMLRVPEKSEFPLPKITSQGGWLNIIKTGACQSCHSLGTKGIRTIPEGLGEFKNSVEAWTRRIQSGGARALMARDITRLDTDMALKLFADWTDRIAAGELPFAQPERPQGIERNIVITLWDWSRPTATRATRRSGSSDIKWRSRGRDFALMVGRRSGVIGRAASRRNGARRRRRALSDNGQRHDNMEAKNERNSSYREKNLSTRDVRPAAFRRHLPSCRPAAAFRPPTG